MEITPLENWITERANIGTPSRSLLEEYQLSHIRETLSYAKNRSRFYAERLKDIEPDAIRSIDDIQKIPFTFPTDIRNDPFSFLCVAQTEISRIVTLRSTGTSGKEKRIFFTDKDLEQTVDFFVYGMSCLTDRTDRVLVLLPGNSYGSIGDLLKKALENSGIVCLVSGLVTDLEKTAAEIVEKNITCLVGIPSQILSLSRTYREIFNSRIKSLLLSTDYVPEVLIRELTEECGCRVFTHYGMTEMGYGGGVECEALNGYHMREADLFFEIVDPISGKNVPDGEWGEAVFTTLTRQAMPLIRYRTGDIASISTEPCACGTFLKTMKRVRGRIDNQIKIYGNEYLNLTDLDEVVLAFAEVRDYRAGWLPDKYLNIEIVTECESVFKKLRNELTESINSYLIKTFGNSLDVEIQVTAKYEPYIISSSMVKRTFI